MFADDIILHMENSKGAAKKLLELINEYGKVAGYKINIQKSVSFLYTNNRLSKKEIMDAISVAAGHCCHYPLPPCSLSGQVRTNRHHACPPETEGERKRRGGGERIQGVGAGEPSCATGVYSYKYSSEYCLDCILKLPDTW